MARIPMGTVDKMMGTGTGAGASRPTPFVKKPKSGISAPSKPKGGKSGGKGKC